MKKSLKILFVIISICANFSFAKGKAPGWFIGIGGTVSGEASAMVPVTAVNGRYTESTYDTTISDGFDQISIHVGTLWGMYDGIEVSYSMLNLNNSSGTKEGSLTLTEIDRIIGFKDWNIGLTNQKIDLLVPFMKIGIGMASWSDSDASSTEDISGTVGKVTLGTLILVGPSIWIDLSYSIREIGFLSTKTSEQIPLQSAGLSIKWFF